MKPLLASAHLVMDQLIGFAAKKQAMHDDWRTQDLYDDQKLLERMEQLGEEERALREQLKDLGNTMQGLLTDEQIALQKSWQNASDDIAILGKEAVDKAANKFLGSLLGNPEQQQKMAEIHALTLKLEEIVIPQYMHAFQLSQSVLRCEIPPSLTPPEGESTVYYDALREIILAASKHNKSNALAGQFLIPHFDEGDRRIICMACDVIMTDPALRTGLQPDHLEKMRDSLVKGGNIARELSNTKAWKKIATRQGISYAIEIDSEKPGIAFRAANRLSQMTRYKGKVDHIHIVDGHTMTDEEYGAMDIREAAMEEPVEHNHKRRLVLRGDAATEILAALGVDRRRIVEDRENLL